MKDCPNLAGCPFVAYCDELEKGTSCQGFISMYCKSDKQDQCIRKRLSGKFGKGIVPKNMMPNGSPIPGSDKAGWSDEALNYRTVL